MSAHKLTIRPIAGSGEWTRVGDLEIRLDGELLDGVTRIEIGPLDASVGGLIHVTLHMCVRPDFELPVKVTREQLDAAGITTGVQKAVQELADLREGQP